MRTFFGLVGLGMFLGFGAIFVSSWRELHAFPAAPRPTTVREAVMREEAAPGDWLELTDVRFPCTQSEQVASSSHYRLGFGASEDDRIIVSGTRPCSDTPVSVVGVLDTASPGRIVGLEFPGYDFEHWPRKWQSALWTANGPDDARDSLILMPPFALLGLVVLAFFWKSPPPAVASLESIASTVEPTPWREGERVLPARPLELARTALYDRVLSFIALLIMGWLLLVLAWFSLSSMGGVFGVIAALFFGVLGGGLVALAMKLPRTWKRSTPPPGERHEALVPLIAQRALDVGNVALVFDHPVTGERTERIVGLQESRPLLVDGQLLVVWGDDPRAVMILAQDFTPFELTPAEQREALRNVMRWVASRRSPG
jgi:hypothetical protein